MRVQVRRGISATNTVCSRHAAGARRVALQGGPLFPALGEAVLGASRFHPPVLAVEPPPEVRLAPAAPVAPAAGSVVVARVGAARVLRRLRSSGT